MSRTKISVKIQSENQKYEAWIFEFNVDVGYFGKPHGFIKPPPKSGGLSQNSALASVAVHILTQKIKKCFRQV